MAKTKTAPAPATDIAVSYGNVSIGDETARIGVSISRGQMSLAQMDKSFCGKRLTGTILARSTGQADQQSLPGADSDITITAVFDVKSFGVKRKWFSTGLTFSLGGIDAATLAGFAKREGMLRIDQIDDIPDKELAGMKDGGDEGDE